VIGAERGPWGEIDGQAVERFVVERDGVRATFSNFGATLIGLEVPDREGVRADVVLGFDTLAEYASPGNPYFGSIVGRCANRIAGARFELDGREYALSANEGRHHLHGGRRGFDRRVWTTTAFDREAGRLGFSLVSPAGEEGYPGTQSVCATYTLLAGGILELVTDVECDAPTLSNLTQHGYFNLSGRGTVAEHELRVRASRSVEVDDELIPTGRLVPLEGSLDFRRGRRLGDALDALSGTPADGLDFCYVLEGAQLEKLLEACRLEDPLSGRTLEIATTRPGLQVYTGNRLADLAGKGGRIYPRHGGVCLETQDFPDAVHHENFPSVVLRAGESRREVTRWRFGLLA
jgi:aldose 1-epimerase